MENFRQSHVSNLYTSRLNASQLSDDSVKSNLESRLEMEKTQTNLMETIRIGVIIFIVVLTIFGVKLLLSTEPDTTVCPSNTGLSGYFQRLKFRTFGGKNPATCTKTVIVKDKETNSGKVRITTEQSVWEEAINNEKKAPDSKLWSLFSPLLGADDLKLQLTKLKGQKPTVSASPLSFPKITATPFTPSLDQVNPRAEEFNLNDKISGANEEITQMLDEMNSVTASPKELDFLLDQESFYAIQLKANDLALSTKNLAKQKNQMEKFGAEFNERAKKLNTCPAEIENSEMNLAEAKAAIEALKLEEEKLLNEVQAIDDNVKLISLESKNSSALLKIGELEGQVKQLTDKLAQLSNLEKQLIAKKAEIDKIKQQIAAMRAGEAHIEAEVADNDDRAAVFRANRSSLLAKIRIEEKNQILIKMKLEFASRNKYIKDFLTEMVSGQDSFSEELKEVFSEQLTAEDHIKEKISKLVESETTIGNGLSLSENEIEDLISHDQEGIKEIEGIVTKLVNTIRLYKDSEIDIEKTKNDLKILQLSISGKKGEIVTIEKELEAIKIKNSKLAEKSEKNSDLIQQTETKMNQLEEFVLQNTFNPKIVEEEIKEKEEVIQSLKESHQREYENFKKQVSELESNKMTKLKTMRELQEKYKSTRSHQKESENLLLQILKKCQALRDYVSQNSEALRVLKEEVKKSAFAVQKLRAELKDQLAFTNDI